MSVGEDCLINVFAENLTAMSQEGEYFTSPYRGLLCRSEALRVISDQVSSTALVVDASGNKVSETRYYPFGEVRYMSGNSPADKTYTGQRSKDFGLMDYNPRYYSLLGRFASADTIVPEQGNLLAWDRYAYTFNNPIFYSDPSGNIPACDNDDWACQTHWDYPIHVDNDEYTFDTGLTERQVEFLNNAMEIGLPIVFEPIDWMMMYEACTQGDCSPLMLVGLIPGIPGVLGNKVDDIIGLLPMPKGGVYTLTNPVGKVVRVGYTKDLVRRAGEYGRAPNFFDLIFKSIYGTDDYATRRGLEQMLYDLYNPPLNINRPIQIRNPNAPSYLAAATKFLNELLGPK